MDMGTIAPMPRLGPDMLERYDIEIRRPAEATAVQFGLGEALLGAVDRLLDGAGIGVACVAAGEADAARQLVEQRGLYTLLVRGYRGEAPVREERVVGCLTEIVDPEADFAALTALAKRPGLRLALLDTDAERAEVALSLAARLLAERWRAGLDGLTFLCAGDGEDCARRAEAFIRTLAAPWGLGEGFGQWLSEQNAFRPVLVESLAFRADAAEVARVCADMNYADAMLHIAEPFVRMTVGADPAEGERLGLAGPGIRFTGDISRTFDLKHRVYDAALLCLAAPGWLLGCDTLSDCMKHERLRAFAGSAVYRELLPGLPFDRETAAAAVIESFERFGNPLNDNRLLRVAAPMLRRAEAGLLPALRAWSAENFDVPEGLSFALAALIMLYAGARREDGAWRVARGQGAQVLRDDGDRLAVFAALSHDMPPEALAYAALADRELWRGEDLRQIDGLEARVALHLAAMQRDPAWLPGVRE